MKSMAPVGQAGTEQGDRKQHFLYSLYRTMLLVRLTEERIATLVETKEATTPCHLYIGQEAIAAGVCAALGRRIRFGVGIDPMGTIWPRAATFPG